MEIPKEVPTDSISISPAVLRNIDENNVTDIASSIRQNGLLQPILVRPSNSTFEVVFGHHRLEACKRLGWKNIPAIVRKMSDDESFLIRVVENLQRNNEINPLAEAKGYIDLIDRGWTINKIAERIGKSDSYVSDRIGLIRRLNPEVADKFNRNENKYLKPSHLEALARLKSKERQLELTYMIERKRLSVRTLERVIAGGYALRETVEQMGDSLYVKLPNPIARHLKVNPGDSVYVYVQSRSRVAIEPVLAPKIPVQVSH